MSERLEKWKAREKIRSDFGWIAVYMGIVGISGVVAGLGGLFRDVEGQAVWLALLIGIGFLWSAVGLWNAKVWSRWVATSLAVAVSMEGLIGVVRGRIDLSLPLALIASVWLLVPSTGRAFARARDTRAARPNV